MAATDLTEVGDRAVALAASLAVSYGCELHVVHGWKVPLAVQMSGSWRDEKERLAMLNKIDDEAEHHILASLKKACPEAEPILHVGNAAPSQCILEGVEKLGVDLLVMGTVSRGGIAGFLVGNTAEKLMDQLQCSLLTIKPEDFVSPVRVD